MSFLKNLPSEFSSIKTSLCWNKYKSVNLYFQDESRFGLMTKQKKGLVSKGIKPIEKFQHSYQYLWLWGCFSPITGDSFFWETPNVNNQIFEGFLDDFSNQNQDELKLVIIDNTGFHAAKNINIPDNVILIRIPPYSPELNPAEKIWQWMKNQVAMKFFESTKDLQEKITQMVLKLDMDLVKSITTNDLYQNAS